MSLDLSTHVLSFLIFWPALGALMVLLVPARYDREIRAITAFNTGISLLVAIWLFFVFKRDVADYQFIERMSWIPMFKIEYFVGVDGISITLVLLTALVTFLATFTSFGIDKMVKGYFVLFLVLNAGMMGVFCALDFFLFFIFWEVMLLPMYFLIGIWGGPRREYAAIKFFLFTFAGSVLMLLGMIALYFEAGTFDLTRLAELGAAGKFITSANPLWAYVWWGIFAAFIVKVPSFPVHTWLPDAHVEAPTPISVILAGVLLKMGGYGILRICLPVFPQYSTEMAWIMAVLGVVSIIYGAFCAMAQDDFKKLVAYASVSSMGFVTLGIAVGAYTGLPAGINGAIFQMFAHGLYSSMLFMVVGVVYDRAHTRQLEDFGGLAQRMPVYTGVAGLAFMTALGLPGLAVFISEAMILIGTWKAWPMMAVLAATSVIITAAYMLWTVQRVFLGAPRDHYHHTPAGEMFDLSSREQFMLFPLAALVILLGFYPMPVIELMTSSVDKLAAVFGTRL